MSPTSDLRSKSVATWPNIVNSLIFARSQIAWTRKGRPSPRITSNHPVRPFSRTFRLSQIRPRPPLLVVEGILREANPEWHSSPGSFRVPLSFGRSPIFGRRTASASYASVGGCRNGAPDGPRLSGNKKRTRRW